jgi:hypothetical protein
VYDGLYRKPGWRDAWSDIEWVEHRYNNEVMLSIAIAGWRIAWIGAYLVINAFTGAILVASGVIGMVFISSVIIIYSKRVKKNDE